MFLAVDHVVEAVEEQGSVDVWSAVNSLRQQRPRMVPTMVRENEPHILNIESLGSPHAALIELCHN